MPRKIRQLIAELERVGWRVEPGGKGSHRKFRPRYQSEALGTFSAGEVALRTVGGGVSSGHETEFQPLKVRSQILNLGTREKTPASRRLAVPLVTTLRRLTPPFA